MSVPHMRVILTLEITKGKPKIRKKLGIKYIYIYGIFTVIF